MEKLTREEALTQIGEVLQRIPEAQIRDATNHLIGIINGMAIANEMRQAKDDGAA